MGKIFVPYKHNIYFLFHLCIIDIFRKKLLMLKNVHDYISFLSLFESYLDAQERRGKTHHLSIKHRSRSLDGTFFSGRHDNVQC